MTSHFAGNNKDVVMVELHMWWRQKPRLKLCRFPKSTRALLVFRSSFVTCSAKVDP
jgi:hypothetical protein